MDQHREPIFNAPWTVMALIGVTIAAYAMQSAIGTDAVAQALGFSSAGLMRGRFLPLLIYMFLHGGWAHVLVNSAFILAFGTPVARRFGLDGRGAGVFYGFYLLCGVLACLGYAALHPDDPTPLVGASGAGSGLMAAASRLMTPGPRLAPLLSRPVFTMAGAWILVNLILAVLTRAGLAGLAPGSGGAVVAWEAHLAGYAAGLLLYWPALKLIGRT